MKFWKKIQLSSGKKATKESIPEHEIQDHITGLLEYLVASIPSKEKAIPLIEEANAFKKLGFSHQLKGLVNLYAFLENYILTNLSGNYINQKTLRKSIQEKFPALFQHTSLDLIIKPPEEQGFLIIKSFIKVYVRESQIILGAASQDMLKKTFEWLEHIPASFKWKGFPGNYPGTDPIDYHDWIEVLEWMIHNLEEMVGNHMGYKKGHQLIEQAYKETGNKYRHLEGFSHLVNVIPKKHLDKEKIGILNNSQMQQLLLDKIEEFEQLNKELQRKNEAISKANEFNQLILDTVGEGILSIDADRTIIKANEEAARIFGYQTSKDILHSSLLNLLSEKYKGFQLEDDEKASDQTSGTSIIIGKRIELQGRKQDGTLFPIEINFTKTYSEDNQSIFTAVLKDITDQKAYQDTLQRENVALENMIKDRTRSLEESNKELKRSNEELENFAYIASHDLREPLRTIISFIQLIDRRTSDQLDSEVKEYISFVIDGAKRMNALIDDLLLYSRVGRAEIKMNQVDMNRVMGNINRMLHSIIEQKEAKINFENLLPVIGDEKLLEQLFQNLVDNALKFCTQVPEITISTQENDHYTFVLIKDNGIGIAPKYKERIFEIFNRLHHKHDFPGTGIGLAICKKIMDRHQGAIDLISNEGEGTTFILRFLKMPDYVKNLKKMTTAS